MKKEIIITTLATLIVGGLVYGATYKDITPQKTEIQIIDDVKTTVNIDTPDTEKIIQKTWTEERTLDFIPRERINELKNKKVDIDTQIKNYNEQVSLRLSFAGFS